METPTNAESIPLYLIRTDAAARDTQVREQTLADTVSHYRGCLTRGAVFPPIQLVMDERGKYFIADGWHRFSAYKAAKQVEIPAVVLPLRTGLSPRQSAVYYATRANAKHGLHLTRGDHRKKAQAALQLPGALNMTYRALAEEIGVSPATVMRARNDLVYDRLIPHAVTGELYDGPREYAGKTAFNEAFAIEGGGSEPEEVYNEVTDYLRQVKALDPRDWSYHDGSVMHRGMVADATVTFSIHANPVENGWPQQWEEIVDPSRPRMTDKARQGAYAAERKAQMRQAIAEVKAMNIPGLSRAADALERHGKDPRVVELFGTLLEGVSPLHALKDDYTDF